MPLDLWPRANRGKVGSQLNKVGKFVAGKVIAGMLILAPVYLAILLLLKALRSLIGLVAPLAKLLPKWLPAAQILALLIVLVACFFVGNAVHTRIGRDAWEKIERSLFRRIPGYALLRSLTQRLAGEGQDKTWRPALAEIEESLVPAFIIEEIGDGRLTVFVPSVPTPLAGAVYILNPDRVHPLNVPFTQAVRVISQWGAGSKDLIASISRRKIA